MKPIYLFVLIGILSCKPKSDLQTARMEAPSNPKPFEPLASYATHPEHDLEVKPFLDLWHQMKPSGAMLIDLRTPPEFDDGYIPGAILINFLENDIDQQLALLDKSKTYFIYCQQGARSSKCLDKMKAMGFTRIYNLPGGYEDYLRSGIK